MSDVSIQIFRHAIICQPLDQWTNFVRIMVWSSGPKIGCSRESVVELTTLARVWSTRDPALCEVEIVGSARSKV